jgi:hypothetical protein
VNKKKILYATLVCAVLGVSLIGIGVAVVEHEPLFTSPLPIFQPFGKSSDTTDAKGTIEKFLKQHTISYTSITVSSSHAYEVQLEDGGTIFLTSDRDLSEQLSSLQAILSRLTMEGKRFLRLDMRYDRPVIVLR